MEKAEAQVEAEAQKAKREPPVLERPPEGLLAWGVPPLQGQMGALGDPRYGHPANLSRKAQALLALQRSHGNGYVQRLVEQGKGNAAPSDGYPVSDEMSRRIEASRSSGQGLEPQTCAEMQAAFGRDFSDVRLHTDSEADQLAREVGAEAFTAGKDVFFRGGNYAPDLPGGKQLLAHELTHVAQQHIGAGPTSVQRQAETVAFGKKEGTTMVATPKGAVAEERKGTIKEIDEMRAALEGAFRARVPYMSNTELIQEAARLDAKLWTPEVEVGPKEKSAAAETLIKMHETLDARIGAAPLDDKGRRTLEGVKWNEGDPLAGIVEGISPFGNIGLWGAFVIAKPKPRPKRRRPVAKVEDAEIEEEEPEVAAEAGKKAEVKSDKQMINGAIKAMEQSTIFAEVKKQRCIRMLKLLLDASVDDRVLDVNGYLYVHGPGAKFVGDPEGYTHRIRPPLLAGVRGTTTTMSVVVAVGIRHDIVHDSYNKAAIAWGKTQSGGGGASADAVKRAVQWIVEKQKDPKSVYSCWKERIIPWPF